MLNLIGIVLWTERVGLLYQDKVIVAVQIKPDQA
jgi:hypothetical protein